MKKLLSLMLALLVMVMPFASLAEQVAATTFAITECNLAKAVEGMELDEDAQKVLPLIDAVLPLLSFTGYVADDQVGLIASVSETPAVTLTVAQKDDTVLVGSNLLGEKTIAVTADEVKNLLVAMAPELVAQGALTQEQADALILMLEDPEAFLEAQLSALFGSFDPEAMLDYVMTEILPLIEITQEACDTPVNGSDVPDTHTAVRIAKENMGKLVKAAIEMPGLEKVKEMIESSLAENGMESMDEFYAEVSSVYADDIVVDVYTADGELCYMCYSYSVQAEEVLTTVFYEGIVKTQEDGTQCVVLNAVITADGTEITMNGDIDINGDLQTGVLTVKAGEDTIVVVEFTGDNANCVITISSPLLPISLTITVISNDEAAQMTFKLSHMEENLLSLMVANTEIEAPAAPAAEGAAHVLTMNEEELNAFAEEVQGSAMTALISVIQLLPAEVLASVMGY